MTNTIQENKRNIYYNKVPIIICIAMVIIIICSCVYFYHHTIIHDGILVEDNRTTKVYQIENVDITDDKMTITGFCFDKYKDTSMKQSLPQMRVILADITDYNKRVYIKAEYGIQRSEVGNYFNNDKYDYSFCGFNAQILIDQIDLNNVDYEIIVQADERNQEALRTGCYIHHGTLLHYNPCDFIPPKVENTDLEEIVSKGFLCAYDLEYGIYIYQYGWNLYLLANDLYPFDQGWNYISCLVETTQMENLPDARKEAGLNNDNIGAFFSDFEITDTIDSGEFRVSERRIPDEYSVTIISLGYVDGEVIWWRRFFPDFSVCFENDCKK